ncbi:DUF4397 domain-containing protein [Mucilaginibacter sp. SP1R1]|uniref:DUF4397 domain-containing protein n=1 Tax=Mucilaginibacter sp. SP1R1 TaxID=2723091 RepID=UPI00160B8454|nr:DUF4397 domain-containing protein [Mucilaginibacter sp. SP1R1]MBB6151073.1 hypothetical protein [Mucilaginibacter sp. SP1R1]
MNSRIKALFVIVGVTCLWACKKNDDAPKRQPTTGLNVVNASDNTINFYQNGARLNNASSYFPGGSLGYLSVIAQNQNYQVKIAGATAPLFSFSMSLDSGKRYSLYVTGKTASDYFYKPDTLNADTSGLTKFRFVNASPNAGPLVLAFEGMDNNKAVLDTIKFNNINYKTITPFVTITGGVRNVSIYSASAPLNAVKDTITLNPSGIYTIYSYGTINASGGQGFGTGLIANQ